ncbi:MAG: signal peptide peptidase SppA [Syntrophales bacterium LBB04]|nr:signal peptide peptidase SppA [Syntrophales bacterium LBB04]
MKKHPVIYGLSLVLLSGVGLLVIFYSLSIVMGNSTVFSHSDKIGIISITGVISSSQDIVDKLGEFEKDRSIRAIVLRIDSPGGGVAVSQEIYSAVKSLKKNKKVVASLGSVAASGGYLIACAADKIVANPGTVTGSISTIMYLANAEELLKKIGLKSSVIKSGKYKDMGSPAREMTADEKKILQGLIDDVYAQFIDVIEQDRKIAREDVMKIADGRVFSGRQAKILKLVDAIGDRSYAVELAATLAGIKGTPEVVYPKKKEVTLWDYIFQNAATAIAGIVKNQIATIPQGANFIYEYAP